VTRARAFTRFARTFLTKYGREDESLVLLTEEISSFGGRFTFDELLSLLNDRKRLIQGEQQGA
jgi:hypothetical protein